MNEGKQDSTPFKDKLVENDFKPAWFSIQMLENNPDKVVRVSNIQQAPLNTAIDESQVDRFQKAKQLYLELKDQYGIVLPSLDYVIGKNKSDETTLFTVTDKIEGSRLKDRIRSPLNVVEHEEVENLYLGLIKYYQDKYTHGGAYLTDIDKNDQYVFGKRKDDEEDKPYLVDLDPMYDSFNTENLSDVRNGLFFSRLSRLSYMIQEGEEYHNAPFLNAKRSLLEFTNTIPETIAHYKYIQQIKETLESGSEDNQ